MRFPTTYQITFTVGANSTSKTITGLSPFIVILAGGDLEAAMLSHIF